MSDALHDTLVTDRESFILFLGLLIDDLRANPKSWPNSTLEHYLEAMASYTGTIQTYYDNTNQDVDADVPSWKVFADILKGAKAS
jgi:hypothetical protein